jgi:hypothetical protein
MSLNNTFYDGMDPWKSRNSKKFKAGEDIKKKIDKFISNYNVKGLEDLLLKLINKTKVNLTK